MIAINLPFWLSVNRNNSGRRRPGGSREVRIRHDSNL